MHGNAKGDWAAYSKGMGEETRIVLPLPVNQTAKRRPTGDQSIPALRRRGSLTSADDSPVDEMSSAPARFMMSLARLTSSEVAQCTETRIPPFWIRPS